MPVPQRRRGGTPPGPPLPQTKVTIVGRNEIYSWDNLIGSFLVHKLLRPRPPPSAPSNTYVGVPGRPHPP